MHLTIKVKTHGVRENWPYVLHNIRIRRLSPKSYGYLWFFSAVNSPLLCWIRCVISVTQCLVTNILKEEKNALLNNSLDVVCQWNLATPVCKEGCVFESKKCAVLGKANLEWAIKTLHFYWFIKPTQSQWDQTKLNLVYFMVTLWGKEKCGINNHSTTFININTTNIAVGNRATLSSDLNTNRWIYINPLLQHSCGDDIMGSSPTVQIL